MKIRCAVLGPDGKIPRKHAHRRVEGAENVSPPLTWSDVPPGTKQLCLSVIDLHPVARRWVHWAVVAIPPEAEGIPEGASGSKDRMPRGCRELSNSYGEVGYGGPNPPRGSGSHDYRFTLYAMNTDRPVPSGLLSSPSFDSLLRDSLLASAHVAGTFEL